MVSLLSYIDTCVRNKTAKLDQGYLVFSVPETDVVSFFSTSTHPSYKYNQRRKEATIAYAEISQFYVSPNAFFKKIQTKKVCDSEIYIYQQGIFEVEDFKNSYYAWLDLFKLLSEFDFENETTKASTYIFVSKEGTTESINSCINEISPEELINLLEHISNPLRLLTTSIQEDAHKGEKQSVLKTSLITFVKIDNKSIIELMCSAENLSNLYHQNYETYLRSFSFDDFITDLEDDTREYINKIEEQIQSFYVQALAIPGAVILASAFRTAEKSISLALIFGTILAFILMLSSLNTKKNFINRIQSNTLDKLDIYLKRLGDIDNEYAKSSIREKIELSRSSVDSVSTETKNKMDWIRDIVIAIFCMYVITSIVLGHA